MAKKQPNDDELVKEAELLYENENFNGVIELLSDDVLEKSHSAPLWPGAPEHMEDYQTGKKNFNLLKRLLK